MPGANRKAAAGEGRPPLGEGRSGLSACPCSPRRAVLLPVHSACVRNAGAHEPRARRRLRGEVLRRRGWRRCSPDSCRPTRRICSSGSTLPTTRPSTGSTTSGRWSSRSTSFRRSSTTRATSARSPRQRPQRRLRDGRDAVAGALGDGVSRGAADRGARRPCSPVRTSGCAAAGAILAGGHTIRDAEPKYGLAVVGTVHPDRCLDEERRPARRRALADEAARHRARPPGAARRSRARRLARRRQWRRCGRSTATPPTRCGRSRRRR